MLFQTGKSFGRAAETGAAELQIPCVTSALANLPLEAFFSRASFYEKKRLRSKLPKAARLKEKLMNIIITNSGGVPIYEQISSQIKGMILGGTLKEGDALPSMRALAQDLRVSVITTKRAYEILESEGFIQSFTGRGSFVSAADPEMLRENNLREIEEHLSAAAEIAKRSGVDKQELLDILGVFFDS